MLRTFRPVKMYYIKYVNNKSFFAPLHFPRHFFVLFFAEWQLYAIKCGATEK